MFAEENGLKGDPRLPAISQAIRVVPHFPKQGMLSVSVSAHFHSYLNLVCSFLWKEGTDLTCNCNYIHIFVFIRRRGWGRCISIVYCVSEIKIK